MRIGLFGGSFDPVHLGHVEPVQEARRQLGLDRVLFLVTAQPPHKPERRFVSAIARFAMVELALLDESGCFACDHELTLGRQAFTFDTVSYFLRTQPEDDFYLMLGMDSLASFHRWRNWKEIAQLVEIVALTRPGWSVDDLPPEVPEELRRLASGPRVHRVENRPIGYSSTELRRVLAEGEVPTEGLSDLVYRYISKYALYR